MMRHTLLRAPLLAGLIAGLVALPAAAQSPAVTSQPSSSQPQPQLGQSWPALKNVSAAPGWRVYVFVQDGVTYIQVNDLVGTVRTAVATESGYFLVLPLGADAQRVSTPARPLAAALHSTAPAVVVYQDSAVQLTARYQGDGSTVWTASAKKAPAEMATAAAKPAATPAATPVKTPAAAPLDCPPCSGSSHP